MESPNMADNPRAFARSRVLSMDQILTSRTLTENDWKKLKSLSKEIMECCEMRVTKSPTVYQKLMRKAGK